MKLRGLFFLLAAFFSCFVLDEDFSDFSDSSSLEDLSLITTTSFSSALSLEGGSIVLLDDSLLKLNRYVC
jgi:hypothetical protein